MVVLLGNVFDASDWSVFGHKIVFFLERFLHSFYIFKIMNVLIHLAII